jgi:mannose/cellobiose epimerase-like protein (N-acyl-D-glucosamine 2-epimerase family)
LVSSARLTINFASGAQWFSDSELKDAANHGISPQLWLTERAKALFDSAMEKGFDRNFGGLYYGITPSGDVCSNGKYSWVQAETIAAAAVLAVETQDNLYWCIYLQLWQYAIDNMVDADLNCWHRNLTFDNKIHDTSGISMGRTDYHSIAACFEIARSLIRSE